MKKVFLWIAISLIATGLSACKTSTKDPITIDFVDSKNTVERTRVIYDPQATNAVGLPLIPLVTDLLLDGFAGIDLDCNAQGKCLDGTIPFPGGDAPFFTESGEVNSEYNPIFSAVSDLDGFSTTAALDITFDGPLDTTSMITDGDNANIFLVPLNYINDPVLGGGIGSQELPQLSSTPYADPVPIVASAVAYSDESPTIASTLRISPLQPLQAATRYLIIITGGVKDTSGIGVAASTTFNFAANAQGEIRDPNLAGLRDAVQQWVGLALGFTNNQLGRTDSLQDIAYTTTFTTAGTTEVLTGMTSPAQFFNNNQLSPTLSKDARYRVEEGIVNGLSDVAILDLICLRDDVDCSTEDDIVDQIKLARHIPQPSPRVASFTRNARLPEDLDVKMYDGVIRLPYYLSSPTGMENAINDSSELEATGARVLTSIWRADNTLSEDLSASGIDFSELIPPSENITRHFPIAKTGDHTNDINNGYIEAPISIFIDNRIANFPRLYCSEGLIPIVYQHGIGGNRRDAGELVSKLVKRSGILPACEAVIAIDLPLHGLDGEDQDLLYQLYSAKEGAIFSIPKGIFAQRHFGLYQDESGFPAAMILSEFPKIQLPLRFNIAENASGNIFFNLINFQGSRDNLRQAVMDSLNLNASLPFLDFNNAKNGPDINMSQGIRYAGHSLGAITGTKLVSIMSSLNQDHPYLNDITTAVLANPAGHITKLLENSFSLSERTLGTFSALGDRAGLDLSEGSRLLELTMHFFQATLESSDPINFSEKIKETDDTGILMYEITGDGSEDNPPDLTFTPAAYQPNGLPPRVILDDLLITKDTTNNDKEDTAEAPLMGSTPLALLMDLEPTSNSIIGSDGNKLKLFVRFSKGSHQSFSSPNADSDTAIFNELMHQTLSFFDSSGESLSINNSDVIVQ